MLAHNSSHAAFAQRLRTCIEKVGSAKRVGELVGVHRNTINGYLNTNEPDRATLLKIADIAGVAPEWLATGYVAPTTQSESQPPKSGGMDTDFLKRLSELLQLEGDVERFSAESNIPAQRLRDLLSGAEMTVSELAAICRKSRTPVSWLFSGKGFDQTDRLYASQAIESFISKLEIIEEERPVGFKKLNGDKRSAWTEGSLPAVFKLFEKIFARLPPARYRIYEVRDNLMSDTMEKDDIAIVMLEVEPTKPGIYLFQKDKTEFFARGVTASDLTTFSFDNEKYDKAAANRLLSPDAGTLCLGRVVHVFGPPH